MTGLFFPPHQDDETLMMGVEIGRHVTNWGPVTVVGVGDGSASSALATLNGDVSCGFHGYRHYPTVEGRPIMTGLEMGAHRALEQQSACAAMGVDEYVPGCLPEGGLTVELWRDLLLEHEWRVADGGTVFVPTPWETTSGHGNSDHGNGGLAMQQLRADGHYRQPGVYVCYSVFSRYWATSGCPTGVTRGYGTENERKRLLAAADVYRAFNPAQGSLGVGWCHSVAADFQAGFVTAGPRYLQQRWHQ